jgi:hypothetical protein
MGDDIESGNARKARNLLACSSPMPSRHSARFISGDGDGETGIAEDRQIGANAPLGRIRPRGSPCRKPTMASYAMTVDAGEGVFAKALEFASV